MSARRPPTKATDDLVDFAEQCLAQRYLKGDVKRLLAAKYAGDHPKQTIAPRTLEVVISAARKRLVDAVGRPRQELIDESLHFYNAVVRNPNASHRDRIRAQESIDRLLGLNAPLRHEVAATVSPAPADLSKLSDAELAAYRAMLAKMVTPAPAPAHLGAG